MKLNKNKVEKISGIVLITIICGFLIWLIFQAHYSAGYEAGIQGMVNTTNEAEKTPPEPITSEIEVVENGYQMNITGFSSHECHTVWCRANAGKPRGNQVALNPKYGNVEKIYIPVYDKEYEVIGTTDQYTDLDIWFGSCYDCAKEFGRKNLLVYLIE